jgi:60 kDa SS-A/Ro ribonucleoprotein
MTSPYSKYQTRVTPQTAPIPGSSQVRNSAGGFTWTLDEWQRLERFLVLGAPGSTYYASQDAMVTKGADTVRACLAEDAMRTIELIRDVSVGGRAIKNDPAIFALALAASHTDADVRRVALDAMPSVCRIGTHLFMFADMVQGHRGWGRALRRAIGEWYTEKDPSDLAYQLVKYRNRGGWTHRDLLRKSHPAPTSEPYLQLFKFATTGTYQDMSESQVPDAVKAFVTAQRADSSTQIVSAIETYGNKLPREAIPPEHLDADVWRALLKADMPMTALIRNLATMTRFGVLTPTSAETRTVIEQVTDGDRLRKARVHPIAILAAMLTYTSGRSARGSSEWAPVAPIADALDSAFYKSFDYVEATGKRWLIGLDVSGSMNGGMVGGVPGLTPRVASSALALTTIAAGDPVETVAFTSGVSGAWAPAGTHAHRWGYGSEIAPLAISARQRLDDVCRMTNRLPFGGTDCSLPMQYALAQGREVDVFMVLTDSETWAGSEHPAQALRRYREKTGINAKLIVVGMVANEFSIADPSDGGMLDVVGMDTSTPAAMSTFAKM